MAKKKTAKKQEKPVAAVIMEMKKFTSFDLAGDDPNPMTVDEVNTLKELVRRLRPNIIVNIGAERGTSTLAMLEEQPFAVIFSIDVAPCEVEFENVKKAGLDPKRVIRILGRSQDVGHAFPIKADMIWVDGDHSYEGVKGDIGAWTRRVRSGGVLAFHDYFEDEPPVHNPSGAGKAIRETIHKTHRLVASVDRLRAYTDE